MEREKTKEKQKNIECNNSQEKMFYMKRLKKITKTKNKPKIEQNQTLIRGLNSTSYEFLTENSMSNSCQQSHGDRRFMALDKCC